MAALTNYLEDKLLDHVLRNIVYTPPATIYLALFTTATTDAGGGTEVTGGSYVRKAVTFVVAGAAGAGHRENSVAVEFTNMPAATVTHGAFYDALTVGNMLLHGALTASQTLAAGANLRFSIGEIDVFLS